MVASWLQERDLEGPRKTSVSLCCHPLGGSGGRSGLLGNVSWMGMLQVGPQRHISGGLWCRGQVQPASPCGEHLEFPSRPGLCFLDGEPGPAHLQVSLPVSSTQKPGIQGTV